MQLISAAVYRSRQGAACKAKVAGGCVDFVVGVDRGFGNHHDVVGDHGDGDGDTKRTPLAAP